MKTSKSSSNKDNASNIAFKIMYSETRTASLRRV